MIIMKSIQSNNYTIWTTNTGAYLGDSKTLNVSQNTALNVYPPNQSDGNISYKESEDKLKNNDNETIKKSFIGFAYGVVASLLIATGTACVQLLEGAVPDFQLTFMRCFVQFLLPLAYFCYKRRLPVVERQHWLWVFLYCLFVNIFNFTNYVAVNYIAAGVASCIRRSVNIVGIAILAAVLLKEKLTLPKMTGVCLSIVGVIICVQPWLSDHNSAKEGTAQKILNPEIQNSKNFLRSLYQCLYGYGGFNNIDLDIFMLNETNVTTSQPNVPDDNNLDEIFGYIMATIAGIVISFGNILIKFRLQDVSPSHLNVYCGAMGTIIPLIISLSTENLTFPTKDWDIVYLFGQTTCWGLASVIGVRAMSRGSIVLLTLAFATQIVFLLIAQYTILSHINPGVGNWVEIFGAVLVVVSAILPSVLEAIELKMRSAGKCQTGCCGHKTTERSRTYSM